MNNSSESVLNVPSGKTCNQLIQITLIVNITYCDYDVLEIKITYLMQHMSYLILCHVSEKCFNAAIPFTF